MASRYDFRSTRGAVILWQIAKTATPAPPGSGLIAPRYAHTVYSRGRRVVVQGKAKRPAPSLAPTLSDLTAINITETTVQFQLTVTI